MDDQFAPLQELEMLQDAENHFGTQRVYLPHHLLPWQRRSKQEEFSALANKVMKLQLKEEDGMSKMVAVSS